MKKCDVLVIGSSAAGLVAANTAKTTYPEKSVTVVRLKGRTLVPCGIPYVFSTVETTENNIIPVEASFMGVKFTAIRLLVSLPLILFSSILLGRYLKKKQFRIEDGDNSLKNDSIE